MEILNYTTHKLFELRETGIYKIIHKSKPNKCYIGSASGTNSSVNIYGFLRRWNRHLQELKHNKHPNQKLQRIVNKYGLEGLEFIILENCNPDKCLERENFYITYFDAYKNGFNLNPCANNSLGRKQKKSTIEKIRKANKGRVIKQESIDKANQTKRLKKQLGIKRKRCGFLSKSRRGSKRVFIYTCFGNSFGCCYSTQDCDKFLNIPKGKSSIYISLRTFVKKQYFLSYKELSKEDVLNRVEEIHISRKNAQLKAWITRKNKKIPC